MKKTANRYLEFSKKENTQAVNDALYDYMVNTLLCGNWSDLRDMLNHLRHYEELDSFKDHIRRADTPPSQKLEMLLHMEGRANEWFEKWQQVAWKDKDTADEKAQPLVDEILKNLK